MMLYVGPDQVIPLSGFFGTAIGLVLIFWGKLTQGIRKVAEMLSARRVSSEKPL
jgi:hypothetical protein